MESKEQVFRHPIGKFVLLYIIVLVILLFAVLFGNDDNFFLICFSPVFVVGVIVALLYLPNNIKISDNEITVGGLFGSNTLQWSEISYVSMRGQSLRLHNRDASVTLSLNSQLNGYSEVLDLIFDKRPDLFDLRDDHVLSDGSLNAVSKIGFGLSTTLFSVYLLVSRNQDVDAALKLVVLGIGLFFVGSWFLTPQKVILENQTLFVKYLFKETVYQASEINWITYKDSGMSGLSILLNLDIRKVWLPALKHGSAISYQFLRRWHEKAAPRK